MYCRKCRKKLSNEDQYCPNCGAGVQRQKKNKSMMVTDGENTSNVHKIKSHKKMWIVLFMTFFIILIMVITGSLLYQNKKSINNVDKNGLVEKQVTVFNNNDMNGINSLLFGNAETSYIEVSDEIKEYFANSQEIGPVGMIMNRTTYRLLLGP